MASFLDNYNKSKGTNLSSGKRSYLERWEKEKNERAAEQSTENRGTGIVRNSLSRQQQELDNALEYDIAIKKGAEVNDKVNSYISAFNDYINDYNSQASGEANRTSSVKSEDLSARFEGLKAQGDELMKYLKKNRSYVNKDTYNDLMKSIAQFNYGDNGHSLQSFNNYVNNYRKDQANKMTNAELDEKTRNATRPSDDIVEGDKSAAYNLAISYRNGGEADEEQLKYFANTYGNEVVTAIKGGKYNTVGGLIDEGNATNTAYYDENGKAVTWAEAKKVNNSEKKKEQTKTAAETRAFIDGATKDESTNPSDYLTAADRLGRYNKNKEIISDYNIFDDNDDSTSYTSIAQKNAYIQNLKYENNNYERSGQYQADKYSGAQLQKDFDEYNTQSTDVPTHDEWFAKSEKQKADNYEVQQIIYGGGEGTDYTYDDNGNVVLADGRVFYDNGNGWAEVGDESAIDDKLGVYESMTEAEREKLLSESSTGASTDDYQNIINEGNTNGWEYIEDDERKIYYYLLNTQGAKYANEYLDGLSYTLSARADEDLTEKIDNMPAWEKALMELGGVNAAINVVGSPVQFTNAIISAVKGEYNPHDKAYQLTSIGKKMRESLATDLTNATGGAEVLGLNAGDIYQAVGSMIDSRVGALVMGRGYTVLMGLGAASNKAAELYDAGATGEEIVAASLFAGVAEALFEYISLDKFTTNFIESPGGNKALKMLVQGLTEGSEEVATELSNTITDVLTLGNKSDLLADIEKYVAKGYTQAEAEAMALSNVAIKMYKAGAGGFISGGLFGISGAIQVEAQELAAKSAATQEEGQYIIDNGGVEALRNFANTVSGVDNSAASKYTNAVKKASAKVDKNASAKNVGKLSNAVNNAVKSRNTADIKQILIDNGMSETNAEAATQILSKVMNDSTYTFSTSEARLLNDIDTEETKEASSAVGKVLADIIANPDSEQNMRRLEYFTARLGKAYSDIINEATADDDAESTSDSAGRSSIIKQLDTDGKVSATGSTVNTSTGDAITIDTTNAINRTEKDGDGNTVVYLNTSDGVIKSTDVEYASDDEAILIEGLSDINPSFANAIIKNYDGQMSARDYVNGMREGVLLYGKYNFTEVGTDISENSFFAQLPDTDQAFALRLGRAMSASNTKTKRNTIAKTVSEAKSKASDEAKGKDNTKVKPKYKKGKVSFVKGATAKTEMQKKSVSFAKHLAAATGIDIVFYDSFVQKQWKDKNGWYNKTTSTIYLDLQAGDNNEQTIAFTMAHEITHFIEQWSADKYKTLSDFLIEQYGKHDVSTDEMLRDKMEALDTDDTDFAMSELVADAMQDMLLDSNAVEKLAELRQEDKSLFEKIKQKILEILESIKSLYAKYKPNGVEANELRKMTDIIEQMHNLFEEAAAEAVSNYQDTQLSFTEVVSEEIKAPAEVEVKAEPETKEVSEATAEEGKDRETKKAEFRAMWDAAFTDLDKYSENARDKIRKYSRIVFDDTGNEYNFKYATKDDTITRISGEALYQKCEVTAPANDLYIRFTQQGNKQKLQYTVYNYKDYTADDIINFVKDSGGNPYVFGVHFERAIRKAYAESENVKTKTESKPKAKASTEAKTTEKAANTEKAKTKKVITPVSTAIAEADKKTSKIGKALLKSHGKKNSMKSSYEGKYYIGNAYALAVVDEDTYKAAEAATTLNDERSKNLVEKWLKNSQIAKLEGYAYDQYSEATNVDNVIIDTGDGLVGFAKKLGKQFYEYTLYQDPNNPQSAIICKNSDGETVGFFMPIRINQQLDISSLDPIKINNFKEKEIAYTPVKADGQKINEVSTSDPDKIYQYIIDQSWSFVPGVRIDTDTLPHSEFNKKTTALYISEDNVSKVADVLKQSKLSHEDVELLLKIYAHKVYQKTNQSRQIAMLINMAADIQDKFGLGKIGFEWDNFLSTKLKYISEDSIPALADAIYDKLNKINAAKKAEKKSEKAKADKKKAADAAKRKADLKKIGANSDIYDKVTNGRKISFRPFSEPRTLSTQYEGDAIFIDGGYILVPGTTYDIEQESTYSDIMEDGAVIFENNTDPSKYIEAKPVEYYDGEVTVMVDRLKVDRAAVENLADIINANLEDDDKLTAGELYMDLIEEGDTGPGGYNYDVVLFLANYDKAVKSFVNYSGDTSAARKSWASGYVLNVNELPLFRQWIAAAADNVISQSSLLKVPVSDVKAILRNGSGNSVEAWKNAGVKVIPFTSETDFYTKAKNEIESLSSEIRNSPRNAGENYQEVRERRQKLADAGITIDDETGGVSFAVRHTAGKNGGGNELFVYDSGSVQKGFSPNELKEYIQTALGDNYTVIVAKDVSKDNKSDKSIIAAGPGAKVLVTKNAGVQYSTRAERKNWNNAGIFMDDSSGINFTKLMLEGKKTIETRENMLLDDFKGKQVGLITKIKGKRCLMGFVTISDTDPEEYNLNEKGGLKKWRADGSKHRISSINDFDLTKSKKGIKYGYHLENPIKLKTPIPLEATHGEYTGQDIPIEAMRQAQAQDSRVIVNDTQASFRNKAPVFYSQMGKIVSDIKQEKIGAGSVVSYLKGKGVKNEEIKWSGIEAFLEGKKSVTKAELQEFVNGSLLQIEEVNLDRKWDSNDYGDYTDGFEEARDKAHDILDKKGIKANYKDIEVDWDEGYTATYNGETIFSNWNPENESYKWDAYKLEGGDNYREILFRMPASEYSNEAMRTHWENTTGVLAHARMQDMETADGERMLFVEEIQSDWHNEGKQKGYASNTEEQSWKGLEGKWLEKHNEYLEALRQLYSAEQKGATEQELNALEDRCNTLQSEADKLRKETHAAFEKEDNEIEDAPFKDGKYIEYVMKRLIRMAAEEGYDSIGWTTGSQQEARWSSQYAEGYRIEYDQDIPKFLTKYGKKWGASVDKVSVDTYTKYGSVSDLPRLIEDAYAQIEEYRTEYDADDEYAQEGIADLTHRISEYNAEAEKAKVWSFPITDSMKESVIYEGQAMYSTRNPNAVSNRTLLANALETTAKNDVEKKYISDYKANIDKLDDLQAHLEDVKAEIKQISFGKGKRDTARLKELNEDKVKTANRINELDKKLLKLEAAKPLQQVLEKEKTELAKRLKAGADAAMARYRERAEARLDSTVKRYHEARKRGIEGRSKTELKSKIKKVIKDLDSLLNRGDRKRNVKNGMRDTISDALSTAKVLFSAMDAKDILLDGVTTATPQEQALINKYRELVEAADAIAERIEGYEDSEELVNQLEETYKKMQDIERKLKDVVVRERTRLQNEGTGTAIQKLADAYRELSASELTHVANSFDVEVYKKLIQLKEDIGGTSVQDMTLEQLASVYEAYKLIKHTVSTANKLFIDGKAEEVAYSADKLVAEVISNNKLHDTRSVVRAAGEQFLWNEMKPSYAVKLMNSGTLSKLYGDLVKGEDTWGVDMREAAAFKGEIKRKHGYDKWDMDSKKTFVLSDGQLIELTIEQMMSIYAYSRRDQALEHMSKGGFVFNNKETFRKTTKGRKSMLKYYPSNRYAFRITGDDLSNIISRLSSEQKGYVEDMQDYLSSEMGAKGNEASNILYGIDIFKEKHYFPLMSAETYVFQQNQPSGEITLKNSGMTKELTPHATNPIVLQNFDDVWAGHINKMSTYHSFVVPIENINKVLNYTGYRTADKSSSVKSTLESAFGKSGVAYLNKLIQDLNGGVEGDNVRSPFAGLIGKFKKTAVAASASVTLQQPTAILRAMSLIDPKYFKPDLRMSHADKWEQLKQYAPVAVIKEMTGFDAAGGGGTALLYLNGATTWDEKVDNIAMRPAGFADEIGWNAIWDAAKNEVAATTDLNGEALLQRAGERFSEVVRETQVYDSTLSRSGYMRSQNDIVKMATAFMGEPTTSFNMIVGAVYGVINGTTSKAQAAKSIGWTVVASIAAAALKSLVGAARKDDDDESYLNKYATVLANNIADELFIGNMLPFVKDAVSIMQGWDVERTDMALVQDLYEAWTSLGSNTKSWYRQVEDTLGAVANLFGVPAKNLLRDTRSIYNLIKSIVDDVHPDGVVQDFANTLWSNVVNTGTLGRVKLDTDNSKAEYESYIKAATSGNDNADDMYESLVGNAKTLKQKNRTKSGKQPYNDEELEKEARSYVKSQITSVFKERYIQADKAGNETEKQNILDEMSSIGLWGELDIYNYSYDWIVDQSWNADMELKPSAAEYIDNPTKAYYNNWLESKIYEIKLSRSDAGAAALSKAELEAVAKSEIRSSVTHELKPLYVQAYKDKDTATMAEIRKKMKATGIYGRADEIIKTCTSWIKEYK